MAKQVARHVIDKTLHIVKYDNRNLWYAPLELIENGIQKILRKKNKMMPSQNGIELRALYPMKFDHDIPIEGKCGKSIMRLSC